MSMTCVINDRFDSLAPYTYLQLGEEITYQGRSADVT